MQPNYKFWQQVQEKAAIKGRPVVVLAPMADVTDVVFRTMISKYSRTGQEDGGPDVMWTEFVAADGLNSPGREVLKRDLEFGVSERPVVAQLFTSNPENMREAVKICKELGFDGVDINMGCPVDIINKQGAGASLIRTPDLAVAVIKAAQEAAGDMPVSVKTRIGYNKIEYKEWLPHILACNVPALTIHLRTRKEMSDVPAHWELYKEIKDFCKGLAPNTFVIGNGDVKDLDDAKDKYSNQDIVAEGVMIGRGAFGSPWRFDWNKKDHTLKEKLNIMLEHTKLYEERLGDIKSFAIMKKHYKAYVNGFSGAKELREKLFECKDYQEVLQCTNEFLSKMETE